MNVTERSIERKSELKFPSRLRNEKVSLLTFPNRAGNSSQEKELDDSNCPRCDGTLIFYRMTEHPKGKVNE